MRLSLAKTNKLFSIYLPGLRKDLQSGLVWCSSCLWQILNNIKVFISGVGWGGGGGWGSNSSCWLYVSSDCSCWCVYSRLPGWGDRVAARGRVRMTQSASCQSCLPNAANLHGKTTHLPLFCRAKLMRSSQTPSTSLGSSQQVSVDALCAGFGACQWLARWN